MKGDVLKRLLQAHAEGDEPAFHKAALQLATAESTAGHVRSGRGAARPHCEDGASTTEGRRPVVDIAQPRGELADILEGGHREERLRDVVLPDATRRHIERVLHENRSRGRLEKWGVGPKRRLLFSTVLQDAERRSRQPRWLGNSGFLS